MVVYAKAPDKRVSIVTTPRGESITAYDGRSGWLGTGGRPPRDMTAAESAGARLDADMGLAARVPQIFKQLRSMPPTAIKGREVVGVMAGNEGAPPVELWFDAQSGLLLRLVRYAGTPLGPNPTQIDYADYRDSGGVKIPFRWIVGRPSGSFTIQIDEAEVNVTIEEARFEKPATR